MSRNKTAARGLVGDSLARIDGIPKATGRFAYGSDLSAEGMLWGVALRSPHASARMRSVDTAAARRAPGVATVLLAADLPGKKTFGLEISDQPVLAGGVVRYEGEPVALVAAEHLEEAYAAAHLIEVDYEPLPVVADMEAAMTPG